MNPFDVTAILVAVAAAAGYVNYRVFRLPPTSGILAVSLVASIALVLVDAIFGQRHLETMLAGFLARIDFNEALMHGMLSFLLFAGALHVDLQALREQRWMIGLLATIGVLLSTAFIAILTYGVFRLLEVDLPFEACLLFGALISPTDPIAVIGLLKDLRAPRALEAQIAGESLFNDGMGVVVFLAILSVVGMSESGTLGEGPDAAANLAVFFTRQVAGGVALGLGFGYVAYRALKSVDHHSLELLITLALVMFMYSVSFWIQVSGPIAVVVSGLLIGNAGRRAMSADTRAHVDAFWGMTDDILNAVLFLMIGLEVFAVPSGWQLIAAALAAIPVALTGRFVSVSLPVTALRLRSEFTRGIVPILTWGGLRGGISVAMALSLPAFPEKGFVLACTYAVVVFSILVQGLTMRRLLAHYAVGAR